MKKAFLYLALLTALLMLYVATVPQSVRVSSSSLAVSYPTVVYLDSYSVMGKPTVSAVFVNRVLAHYRSPAAGLGQELYDDGLHFGIDPVYALAFFLHEDGLGTTGWGAVNQSLGNTRCTPGYHCRGGYRAYATWASGTNFTSFGCSTWTPGTCVQSIRLSRCMLRARITTTWRAISRRSSTRQTPGGRVVWRWCDG